VEARLIVGIANGFEPIAPTIESPRPFETAWNGGDRRWVPG